MAIHHTRTNIDIETTHLDRFKELYPQHGAIKWFVNKCFEKFMEQVTDTDELIHDVVSETLTDEMQEEEYNED